MVQVGLSSGRVVKEACRVPKESLPLCFKDRLLNHCSLQLKDY